MTINGACWAKTAVSRNFSG